MSNAYSGILKEFVDNIISQDVLEVRTEILQGKRFCIVVGNAVWHGKKLVGVLDSEVGVIEDFLCEDDFYLVDDILFDDYQDSLEVSEDIVPLVAEYEGKGEFLIKDDQLDFVKDYVLGQDRKRTFAYFLKYALGTDNPIILDKSVLLKDWDIVRGINEEELKNYRYPSDLPIGCCESVFDVFDGDVECDFYKSLPYLRVESVLSSKYLGNEKRCKDVSGIITDTRLEMIRGAIHSVGLLCNPEISSGELDMFEGGEGSFCLFNGINGKLWIATVSTTDIKYEENRVIPVDLLTSRVHPDGIGKWDFGECVDTIYEFAKLVNRVVEKHSNMDVQSVFVFPCGRYDMPKAYVVKNTDGSCTMSLIIPYYK